MNQILNRRFTEFDTTATIRARNKVADIAEKVKPGEMILLEDADFATAQAAIKLVRWSKPDRYVIHFAEQFEL